MQKFGSRLVGTLALLAAASPAFAQEGATATRTNVAGAWEFSWTTPRGAQTANVTFEQDGRVLTGTATLRMGEVPVSEGSVSGNQITFTLTLSRGDRSFPLRFTGTVDGDSARGTMAGPGGRGDAAWTAKRASE